MRGLLLQRASAGERARYDAGMHGIELARPTGDGVHTTTGTPQGGRRWRAFLRAAGWVFAVCAPVLTGCASIGNDVEHPERFEYAAVRMGTRARVVMYGSDEPQAAEAARQAFAEMERLEQIMSDYRPTSELNHLADRAGTGWVAVSCDLSHVLQKSARVSEASGGAFDATIGPATQLWRAARDAGTTPDPDAVRAARSLIDWTSVKVDAANQRVHITTPGVLLDLGGIGKGAAAWSALQKLRALGFPRALVSLAGDVAVGEAPPGAAGWTIVIQWPGPTSPGREEACTSRPLVLANTSISTSGAAEQWIETIEAGQVRRRSHVIDPRTAQGVWTTRAITIVGPGADSGTDAGTADALATAGLVLLSRGDEAGVLRMMAAFPSFAAIMPGGEGTGTVAGTPQSDDMVVIDDRNVLRWAE